MVVDFIYLKQKIAKYLKLDLYIYATVCPLSTTELSKKKKKRGYKILQIGGRGKIFLQKYLMLLHIYFTMF